MQISNNAFYGNMNDICMKYVIFDYNDLMIETNAKCQNS